MKLIYKVSKNCEYQTIKQILIQEFNISNKLISKLKAHKQILLNGKNEYVTKQISNNDILEVLLDFDEEVSNIIPTKMNLEIVYEDDSMIILNKPPFVPVHPSLGYYETSLSNGLKYYYDSINLKRKIRPVNRLDKNTSGLVIFAKNEYVQEKLSKQMKLNEFLKKYIAILTGYLETKEGTINCPIARKENSIIERCISKNGKPSITHYKVLKEGKNLSLVEFKLETGRTHQIRLHSKHIGHPILGDSLYGIESDLINRQALHAYYIKFIHPITKQILEFKIPLPDDMRLII